MLAEEDDLALSTEIQFEKGRALIDAADDMNWSASNQFQKAYEINPLLFRTLDIQAILAKVSDRVLLLHRRQLYINTALSRSWVRHDRRYPPLNLRQGNMPEVVFIECYRLIRFHIKNNNISERCCCRRSSSSPRKSRSVCMTGKNSTTLRMWRYLWS